MLQHSIVHFLHEQFAEQGLFEESLHLQCTNLSKSVGAVGFSVCTGWYNLLWRTYPHSKGSTWAFSRSFQSITCRYTRQECCCAAFSEGESNSILILSFVVAISIYLEYLIIPSDSSRIAYLNINGNFKLKKSLMNKPLWKKKSPSYLFYQFIYYPHTKLIF